jgi:hypothetical protein
MVRRHEIDGLRGLLLALMMLTHLPTRFGQYTGQPYGFVSAAEGFIFLSGFMVGLIYVERAQKSGVGAMRRAVWHRALVIYACQVGLLLFLLAVIAPIGAANAQPAINDLVSFFNHERLTALWSGMVLLYDPPLLDILPLYVLFMLATPLILLLALRRGWVPILTSSFGLWLLAQFDIGRAIFQIVANAMRFDMPYAGTGAFSLLAWQFLWVIGLWLGSIKARAHDRDVLTPRWIIVPAVVLATVFIVWRHVAGQTPFPSGSGLNMLFDKWHLSPLRLLNFLALLVITLRWGHGVAPWLARPHFARLGAASLPVFCAHLVICLLALAFFGDQYTARGWDVDVALLIGSFAALYAVAEAALRAPALLNELRSGTARRAHIGQLRDFRKASPNVIMRGNVARNGATIDAIGSIWKVKRPQRLVRAGYLPPSSRPSRPTSNRMRAAL